MDSLPTETSYELEWVLLGDKKTEKVADLTVAKVFARQNPALKPFL